MKRVLKIEPLPLEGLKCIVREPFIDERGSLTRIFCLEELTGFGWDLPIAQLNYTVTKMKGTVRGLHYQSMPFSEVKLVTCLSGMIWDVAVDLRRKSPTFLHWHAEILSVENNRAILIPEGFAHGFQTLSDHVELLYCHSKPYTAHADAGINPIDPTLKIAWPQPITVLSKRDEALPIIDLNYNGVDL